MERAFGIVDFAMFYLDKVFHRGELVFTKIKRGEPDV